MAFFRNPEVRRSLLLYALASALVIGAGRYIGGACGLVALIACAAMSAVHLALAYGRYRKIAELSRQIDSVLHGHESVSFESYEEGELAILRSEIAKMTVRLREQRAALQADKSHLTDSIADISHQLKTPLTSINLLLSFLEAPELPPERRLQLVRDLSRLTGRIDWLVSSLLKLSRLDAGTAEMQRERVLLGELIRKAAAPLLVPMELRGQSFTVEAGGNESFIGDLAWASEAVSNLLKNCMEHTPEGGAISVTCAENAIYTELVIRDSGPGFAPDDLPRLFERFYKGKGAGAQSVGIGLALARRIITEQNGSIKAENAPGGGARFAVRFYKGTV